MAAVFIVVLFAEDPFGGAYSPLGEYAHGGKGDPFLTVREC
jgi:hypothetical protein